MATTRELTTARKARKQAAIKPSPAYTAVASALHDTGKPSAEEFTALLTTDRVMCWAFYRLVELIMAAVGEGKAPATLNTSSEHDAAQLRQAIEGRLVEVHHQYAALRRAQLDGRAYRAAWDHMAESGLFGEWLHLSGVLETLEGSQAHHPLSFAAEGWKE